MDTCAAKIALVKYSTDNPGRLDSGDVWKLVQTLSTKPFSTTSMLMANKAIRRIHIESALTMARD
jgi:hypothetical protein